MTRRPLPRSLDPLPDESLPGFLLRLAHRLDRTPARIYDLTGIIGPGQIRPVLGRRLYLDPATRDRFATATRLHPDEVVNLCVAALADRYAPLNARFLGRTRKPESVCLDPWVFGRAIRFCPPCLAGDGSPIQTQHGGAWQRRWHLPVVFACPAHQQLLTEHCPACRHRVQHDADQPVAAPSVPGLHPAQCRHNLGRTIPGQPPTLCGHRLDHTPPPGDPPRRTLFQLQERILRLLDPSEPDRTSSFGQPSTVAEYFTDLRLMASLTTLTWPTAAPLVKDTTLRDALDHHATSRRETIAEMRAAGKTPRSHAIYDQPPTGSFGSGAQLHLLDQLSNNPTGALAEMLGHPAAPHWTRNFFTAEPYCSAGLRTTIAAPISSHRLQPRPAAKRSIPPHRRRARPFDSGPTPAPLLPKYRFGPHNIPAFLTNTWYIDHLQHLTAVNQRMLRRATAATLVARSGNLTISEAAQRLGLPPQAPLLALQTVRHWRTADPANARAHDAALDTLIEHLENADHIDYQQRRHTMATWTISTELWQLITTDLRRIAPARYKTQPDYSDRKRITASALVWIDVTQGEHLHAPQRHSPAATPGTTQDHGLSIDTAWWHLRIGRPGHHYWDLRTVLTPHIHQLAIAIDEGHPNLRQQPWTESAN